MSTDTKKRNRQSGENSEQESSNSSEHFDKNRHAFQPHYND